jgi:hypothetical protein
MGLPWVRLDSNIASHDKILDLLGRHKQRGKAAAFVYVCSIAYAGGNGTDGLVSFNALPFIHATKADAQALVDVGLWDPHPAGWTIRNFGDRQQLSAITDVIQAAKSRAGIKGSCIRWHGPDCHCWERGPDR